jgi:hypothetical protein
MFSILNFKARKIVQSHVTKTPCSMAWNDMDGDERVRFCGACKLNVHNISSMSEGEAAKFLANRKGRTCVYYYRGPDGVIVTDNCPKVLRQVRNRIAAYAAGMLIVLSMALAQDAYAQELAGPPVDPRYGQCNEIGQLADYGYDCARDISRIVTWVSAVVVWFVPIPKKHCKQVKSVILHLLARFLIPLLVHCAGWFVVNNMGGLGGGL